MANIEMHIEGLEELKRKVGDAKKFLGQPLREFFNKSVIIIERRVKGYTPVKTGRLRASMAHLVDASPVPLWGQVGTDVYYAPYVEFKPGKPRRMGRIPFMRPALADSVEDVNRFAKEACDEIEKAWGK